ncbi:MAG: hypothetical protein PHD51_00610 [Patescibacteria group bacterium]|nr:hypothetical protein [Patescibacteria group bacterium]MDD5490632.1 hypothetical protein [Patescibacteria group bacterium]
MEGIKGGIFAREQCRVNLRFLDLRIKLGKTISKACWGFNLGANKKKSLSGFFYTK